MNNKNGILNFQHRFSTTTKTTQFQSNIHCIMLGVLRANLSCSQNVMIITFTVFIVCLAVDIAHANSIRLIDRN